MCVCVCVSTDSSNQPTSFQPQQKDLVIGSISFTVDFPDIRAISIINFLYTLFRGTAIV